MNGQPCDPCSLTEAVAQHARNCPDAVALEGAFANLTYAALLSEYSELAALLGEDAPAAMGLWMDNTPAWLVTDLAAMQAWIPLAPMPMHGSPQQLGRLIGQMITDAGLELVMTDRPGLLRRMLDEVGIGISDEDGLDIAGVRVHLLQLEHPAVCAIAESVARVSYDVDGQDLSHPAGVCLPLHAMQTAAVSMQEACGYSAQDRHLCALPLASPAESSAGAYAVLLSGGVCVLPGLAGAGWCGEDALDGARFLRAVHQRRISSAVLTPQMLASVVAAIEAGSACPTSLRHLAVIGRSAPLPLLQKADELGLPIYAGYGRRETAGVVAINTPQANRIGSVGRLLPHIDIDISDDGEIMLRGALFSAYLGQDAPELVHGFWPSGDVGYLDDDGFLYLNGRIRRSQ